MDNKMLSKKREREGYSDLVMENKKFETYYKDQLKQFFPTEESFQVFLNKMKEKLPVTFRANPANSLYELFKNKIMSQEFAKEYNLDQFKVKIEQKELTNQEEYKGSVFVVSIPRFELRKNKDLSPFHKFVQTNADTGIISRQEAVSMIPPMLLNASRKDSVFDLCAAPGSKTAQFLEKIYRDYDYFSPKEIQEDTGFVLANDLNPKRAYMMAHQLKRLNTAGMIVIAHDAQHFPSIWRGEERLQFDKVLADVPCSSDAVMRKLPVKWKDWTVRDGLQLHKLQLQILRRGVSSLKVGGEIVYSTCSLNPVENEAVVASLMRMHPGCVEIVDCSKRFKGAAMKPREGMTWWKVYAERKNANEMEELDSYADVKDEELKKLVAETCFPVDQEENKKMGLEKCIRFLPQDADTSGFFITLLRKVEPMGYGSNRSKSDKKAKKDKGFSFLSEQFPKDAEWMRNFYDLTDDFPLNQLVTQSNINKKVNFISKGVADLLRIDERNHLKIVALGVKLFEKQKMKEKDREETFCHYRICQDGVENIVPFMRKNIVFVEEEQFKAIVARDTVGFDYVEKSLVEDVRACQPGSFVICNVTDRKAVLEDRSTLAANFKDAVCCYMAKNGFNLMLSREHKHQLALKYGV